MAFIASDVSALYYNAFGTDPWDFGTKKELNFGTLIREWKNDVSAQNQWELLS